MVGLTVRAGIEDRIIPGDGRQGGAEGDYAPYPDRSSSGAYLLRPALGHLASRGREPEGRRQLIPVSAPRAVNARTPYPAALT